VFPDKVPIPAEDVNLLTDKRMLKKGLFYLQKGPLVLGKSTNWRYVK